MAIVMGTGIIVVLVALAVFSVGLAILFWPERHF
jgi:hypothetical protein